MKKMSEMPRPWSCQIEITEGCNLGCGFCAVPNVVKKVQYMTIETAVKVAQQLRRLSSKLRIECAMGGEPMLNKDHAKILRIIRKYNPGSQIQITTNGTKLAGRFAVGVTELFNTGVNLILVDLYEEAKHTAALKKEIALLQPAFQRTGIKVYDFYSTKETPYRQRGMKHREIFLMGDLSSKPGERSQRVLFNHAGNVDFARAASYGIRTLSQPLKAICTNVFREVTVKSNGDVCICCMDFGRKQVIGNIHDEPLETIWYGRRYDVLRTLLFRKVRLMHPCVSCDYPGGCGGGSVPSMCWQGKVQ